MHWYCLESSRTVKKGMLRSVQDLKARIRTLEQEVSKFMIEEEDHGGGRGGRRDEGGARIEQFAYPRTISSNAVDLYQQFDPIAECA